METKKQIDLIQEMINLQSEIKREFDLRKSKYAAPVNDRDERTAVFNAIIQFRSAQLIADAIANANANVSHYLLSNFDKQVDEFKLAMDKKNDIISNT